MNPKASDSGRLRAVGFRQQRTNGADDPLHVGFILKGQHDEFIAGVNAHQPVAKQPDRFQNRIAPSTMLIGNPTIRPGEKISAQSAVPRATLNAPSNGAPT